MVREGTRSQTGNSKPRVFTTPDTDATTARTAKPKPKKAVQPPANGAKPAGVTKRAKAKATATAAAAAAATATAKKNGTVDAKTKDDAGKAEKKVVMKKAPGAAKKSAGKVAKASKPKPTDVDVNGSASINDGDDGDDDEE